MLRHLGRCSVLPVVAWITATSAAQEPAGAPQLRPLYGQVIDADGAPIEGAEVHCVLPNEAAPRNRGDSHLVVTTDARGRFRADICPCTPHVVWAIGPDRAARVCSNATWASSGKLIELRADRARPACELTITGLERWQELAPFRVRVAIQSVEIPSLEYQVNEDGTCAIAPLPAGRVQFDVIDKHGQPLGSYRINDVGAAPIIRVPPPVEIPLRAIDENGEPLAGVTISLRIYGGYSTNRRLTPPLPRRFILREIGQTDAEGRLVARIASEKDPFKVHVGLGGPARTSLMFFADKDGHKSSHSGFVSSKPYQDGRVTGDPGDVEEVLFTMPKAAPVAGQVRLDLQRGVAEQPLLIRLGLRVESVSGQGWSHEERRLYRRTDAAGAFVLPQINGKVENVDVILGGATSRTKLMAPPLQRRTPRRAANFHGIRDYKAQPLLVTVGDLPTIDLQVLDENSGPASDLELIFLSMESGDTRFDDWTAQATTDSAGRVAMMLERGKWFVFGRNDRHMVQLAIDVKGDQQHTLRLQPMPTMRGKVVDAAGAPVSGAKMAIHSSSFGGDRAAGLARIALRMNWRWINAVRSDANGEFRCVFLELPRQTYRARVHAEGLQSERFPVESNEELVLITVADKK